MRTKRQHEEQEATGGRSSKSQVEARGGGKAGRNRKQEEVTGG